MTNELKKLVDDYGGGREKSNNTSKKFYNIANKVLAEFDRKPYSEIELFLEYLKEVSKRTCTHISFGLEEKTN